MQQQNTPKPGGSDKFYYEDLENANVENLMTPKLDHEITDPPSTNRELLPTITLEKSCIQMKNESEKISIPPKKLSLNNEQSEHTLKKKAPTPQNRLSILNIFGHKNITISNVEETKKTNVETPENSSDRLNLLTKLTRFFNKKITTKGEDALSSEKLKETSILKKSTTKIHESMPTKETLKRKESLAVSKDIPKRKDNLNFEEGLRDPIHSKVIYEEVIKENEKDEFENEVFQDNIDFENKLMRDEYYEHLKVILNTPEEDDNQNILNINSDDEEEETNRNFRTEGLIEYEKDYQKLVNSLVETQGSLYTEKKNDFELIKMYSDHYPLLKLRKEIIYFLSLTSFICLKIIKNRVFETLSLLLIIWNTVFIMIQDNVSFTDSFDLIFLILYTIEMMLKIFALGFILNTGSYLRDYWNILDFTIITTGYIPYLIQGNSSVNLKVLRSLRVLRPLRTISSIKNLKILLVTLFSAFPLIMNSVFVVMFFLLVFAIAGLQLLAGMLKKRCFDPSTGLLDVIDNTDSSIAGVLCGYDNCFGANVCGKAIANPNFGIINFDNIFYSFLMVFQCITLEGWTQIMFYFVRTFSIYMVFFFIILVWIGAYFLVNLTLAVINTTFSQSKTKKIERKVDEQKAEVDETAITIEDIRFMKLGERSHHKRSLRIMGKSKLYGASEDDKTIEKNKLELRWEDLLELKERIIEEQERLDADENFNKLREIELDQKPKVKKKVQKKRNMKYLPKASENMQLKDLQSNVLPLRFLMENRGKKENHKLQGMRIMEICGVSKAGLMKNQENSSQRAMNIRGSHYQLRKSHANIKKPSIYEHHQNPLKDIKEIKEEEIEEEELFLKYIEKLPKNDVSLKNEEGIDIFSLKNKKKTLFFVKTKPTSKVEDYKRKYSEFLIKQKSNKEPLGRKLQRTKTFEEKDALKPNFKKRTSDGFRKKSEELQKHTQFADYLFGKLNKEEDQLKIHDLELLSSSFSSRSSSLSEIFLNDSDFNIGFVEKLPSLKDKKSKSKKTIGSKKDLFSKKGFTLREKLEKLEKPRKMSKKTSIMISERQSRPSRAIMSSLLLDLKKMSQAAENIDKDNDSQGEADPKKDENNDNVNAKTPIELKKKSVRNQSKIIDLSNAFYIKDNKMQEITGPFNFNPNNKNFENLNKKGFFKKIFTGNNAFSRASKNRQISPEMSPTSPTRRRRGLGLNDDKEKTLKKFQKQIVPQKKKPNVLFYKLMVNHEKNYESTSQEDVLQYRHEKEKERKEKDLDQKLKSVKYGLSYTLKKFKVKKLTKPEKKKQMQLLKEITNAKKKSIDFQSLNNLNILKKILNITQSGLRLPLIIRFNLFVILKQQREVLFGSRTRFNKTLTSMSPTTNVSMISMKGPLVLLKKEKEKSKKRKKKVVEIDEKLNYEEWKLKLKEKLYDRITREEIEEVFTNRNDFINIREADFDKKDKKDFIKYKNQNFSVKWSGEDVCHKNLRPGLDWSNFQKERLIKHINKMLKALNSRSYDKEIWLIGFKGKFRLFQKHLLRFIEGKIFDNSMIICVLFNTVILAMDGLFTDVDTTALFTKLNLAFTVIFSIEMGSKIMGYGMKGYISDKMNIFDGIIVILSLVEVIVMSGGGALSAFRSVRIFRTFRVLRVTRLLRSLHFMGVIIDAIMSTLDSSIYVGLLLLLLLVIYSMIGTQLFQGKLNNDYTGIRQTFDNFEQSFLVAFQLLTVENWNDLMTVTMVSSVGSLVSCLYLISWIFLGNYVLLNLFLSILLSGFSKVKHLEEDEIDDDEARRIEEEKKKQLEEEKEREKLIYHSINDIEDEFIKSSLLKKGKPLFDGVFCNESLYTFSKRSWIRIKFYKIVHSDLFENFILGLIMLSSFKLALDTYFLKYDPNSEIIIASNDVDYLFNVCFLCEALLKIISFGFFMDDGSYLRENWNVLDFFIVVSSMVDMCLPNIDLPFIKVLRLLRILRPLRFVSHNLSMKIVVTALLNSVSSIFNVFIVMFLIFLMVAILGMSLMGDRMGYCGGVANVYGINYDNCVNVLKQNWYTYDTNFDNVFHALLTVFILSTQEGWPNIMYYAIDSNTSDIGPIKGNYSQISLYFVLAMTVCNIFLLNLFIGVIFYHFNAAQNSEQGKQTLFLTGEQERWLELHKLILIAKPDQFLMLPHGRINILANKIINFKYFDGVIMVCIVCNIVTMALTYEGSPSSYDTILDDINYGFTGVFISECILKMTGLGVKGYLYSSWNKFDLFVVSSSILDILMNNLGGGLFSFLKVGPQLARILRVMRVSRLLKLVKSLKGIQKMLETLTLSLPSLMNVGALVLLVFFIYSVLGVFLFSDVNQGGVIDTYNNFNNFGMAMVLLIRCSTGENWWIAMFDCGLVAPNCTPGETCGNMFAPLFFVTFMIICTFIFLNLFIFVILSEFGKHSQEEENPTQLFKDNLIKFRKVWSRLTMISKGIKLPSKLLIDFFKMLEPPMGFGKECRRELVAREIMKMNLLGDEDGNVYFNELLFATLKHAYGTEIFKNASIECVQLFAKEELQLCERLEKIKNRTIHLEKQKRKFSNKLKSIRASLRISFARSHNSVVPQDSFKETDLKTPTTNSNTNTDMNPNKQKKKVLINPMITILFLGMAFKAWKSFTTKKQEGLLLSNDSLPVFKNEDDDDDWDEEDDEECEENYDEFDENEQKEFESKNAKSRRVGFANFGEIKEEEEDNYENNDNDKSKEGSEDENQHIDEKDKYEENHNENIENANKKMLQSKKFDEKDPLPLNEKKSILKSNRLSLVTPEEKRESRFIKSPLVERGSRFQRMTIENHIKSNNLVGFKKHQVQDSKSDSGESGSDESK